jgi:hypothetical protein
MKPTEANAMAQKLKGLLPRMTDEQVLDWAERFERFELPAAQQAVGDYVENRSELETPVLLLMLRAAGASLDDGGRRRQEENVRLQKEVADVDRRIETLSDAQLATAKCELLETLPGWTRRHIEKSDARSSAILKALIVEHIKRMAPTQV